MGLRVPETLGELKAGTYFRFRGSETVYEARGNAWYGSPGGYDGGPWHGDREAGVTLYECSGCGENYCPGCLGRPRTGPV
jgi:hypothetical protein